MAKKREIIITCNAKQVQDTFDFLNKSLTDIKDKMKALNKEGADNGWTEQMKKEFAELEKMATSINNFDLAPAEKAVRKFEDVLKNLAGSTLKDVKRALNEGKSDLNKMAENDPNRAKLTEELAKIARQIDIIGGKSQSLAEAKKQLSDLGNTSTEKLRQGLAAINKELETNAKLSESDRAGLRGMARQYEAQLAVNQYGKAGTADISKMNAEQLRAEQQRLRQGYMATEGAKGYETVSQEYLNRLQQVNQTIKERAEAERIADKATRERIATQEQEKQVVDVLTRVNQQQKVTLDELRQSEKFLQDQIARMEGQNLPFADQNKLLQAKASLQDIQEVISHITLDHIDFDALDNKPVEELEKLLKQIEEDEKRLAVNDKQASEQMAANKRKVQQAIQRVKNQTLDLANAQKVAGERGKHSVQDMQRAYDTLKVHLTTLSTSQKKEIAETRQQMRQLKADIDRVTESVSNQNSIWKTAVRNITAYVGVFGAFNLIKNKLTEVIRGSEDLSDQMAKVRMVSGLAMEDIENLTRSLAKLDTRSTLQELTELSYIGSKLGFGEMGVGALEEFAKAANQVNVALKEDLGSEAMTALSKITENMGLIKKMGVEQAMLSTSSAMFKLFTSSTAAAGPIVEVTKRLAPMAQISGFATHEILALASASDALMQSEEVAGTAMSKFMMAMQNNHNVIEKTLGMTEGSIATMMKSGKSMEAFLTILDKMSGKNVTELQNVWKLLGSEGDRLIRVILAMANHTDLVRQHLDTSNKAFREATAVTEEYNIQQETALGYLQRADNKWRNAFINPDSALAVKEMTKAWYDFTKSITDSDFALGAIKVTVDFLLLSLRALIALLPAITFGLLAKGARMLYDNMKLANIATEGFITSWKKMDNATKSNWIGMIAGTVVQAIYWFGQWAKSINDVSKEQKQLSKAIETMHEKTDEEIKKLSRLKSQLDDTNISQEERNALLSKVRNDYDIYLNYLGIEKSKVMDLTKHYDALVKVMKQRFAYEERENYKRDVMSGEDGVRMKRRSAGADLNRLGQGLGVDADLDLIQTYVKGGKSAEEIFGFMFPDVKADELAALQSRPKGSATYATPGAAATAANDFNHSFSNFKKALEGYVGALQAEIAKENEIDAAFASEIGDFDYDKWLRTQVQGEFVPQPDKAAIAAAKKAAQDEKQALRKDLQDAKQDSDAVISKIEEWYRLQETVITDMQADGKLTKEQAEQVVRTLNIAKNTALRDARLAISGRDTKAWEQTKQQIGDLMLDQGKWSQELLEQILGVSMENIRANLAKIDKGGGKYGITTSSLKDAVDKNAAGNQREIARLMARAQQEVEKIFMEYDFFEQAMRGFSNRLAQMGILSETARNMAERLTDANDVNTMFSMKDYDALLKGNEGAKQQMLQAFIASGAQPYGVNPEDKEQLRAWFMEFVGEFVNKGGVSPLGEGVPNVEYQYQSWAKPFEADFDLWLRDSDKYLASIQSFYLSLMKSEEDYYEKRKQSYNHYKKQLEQQDQAAGIPTQREDKEKRLQTKSQMQDEGIGASFWRQQGLGGILNDPEVMLIQQRIQWRNEDLESAKALLAGKEALWQQEKAQRLAAGEDEASIEADLSQRRMGFEDIIKERQTAVFDQQLSLTTKIAQEMRKRVQTVNSLTKPIQDGAENIGKKFGEMLRGVEEDSMTWNEIWRSMAQAVGDSIVDMMAQYAQNMIMEKMMNQQSKSEALSKAQVDVAAGTASAAAKTVGTLGWWGLALIPVIAAVLHGLLAAAFASNKSSDTSKSSATKIKLASGMLTYDEGNVGTYLGQDGRVYRAREDAAPKTGLITKPIATTVQGQPALVAERGPEIVIGRRTTRRIQMAAPELLHAIQLIDRGYTPRRLYDEGTPLPLSAPGGFADGNTQQSYQDAQMQQTLAALTQTVAVLSATVTQLQKNGIPAHINKYGSGGLIEEVKSGLKFDARYNK